MYAADNLEGGASSEDVVYLADNTLDEVSGDNYEADLYFMEDMSLAEDLVISDENITNRSARGFYTYEVDEDDVYTLDDDEVDFLGSNEDVEDETDNVAAEDVNFDEVYNYLITSADNRFDAISFADAVVIDTRSSSDRNDNVYDNEINTASKLSTAIERTEDTEDDVNVVADVFIQDGEIVFVAVTEVADGEPDEDDENQNASFDEVVLAENGNVTFYEDDEPVAMSTTEEHDWELYRYTANNGWQLYRSGDDYVYSKPNPWTLRSGYEYYVVIDGVESNIVDLTTTD